MRETKQRNYFCVIDGVIGMDGEGPIGGDPIPAGVVLAGDDPVAVDTIAAEVMGFDSSKLPTIRAAGAPSRYALGLSDLSRIDFLGAEDAPGHTLPQFTPAHAWVGHIERKLVP
jgi:uncharacterized protein (DUF362 family)